MQDLERETSLVVQALQDRAGGDDDHWSYARGTVQRRRFTLFQYPAMMVPEMLEDIIVALAGVSKRKRVLLDPFMGSGTTLTEAMRLGLNYVGRDINPLAVLICVVKRGPYFIDEFREAGRRVAERARVDRSATCESQITNVDKWFLPKAAEALSRLARAIRAESSVQTRRFLWLALSETVRLTSNSRTSTYKLHKRSDEQMKSFRPDPARTFERAVCRNLGKMTEQAVELAAGDRLKKGWYTGDIDVGLGDSMRASTFENLAKASFLLTSPPYGDNHTTIPYGQSAYLPLSWVDWNDIPGVESADHLLSTHEVDSRSLGGSKAGALDDLAALNSAAKSFKRIATKVKKEDARQLPKVAAFFRDLRKSIDAFLPSLRDDAYLCFTLGNRRVAGLQVPLDQIVQQLLEQHGCKVVATMTRSIHGKKMASRNNLSKTIDLERVLILRR
jgi:hypothetical protein